MAVKVFDRQKLKKQRITKQDGDMSNMLESIQDEIKVWERSKNVNVIKIFELFDAPSHPEIYLLMEKAQFG